MNSCTKNITILLFMVVCVPSAIHAAGEGNDCFHARQMHHAGHGNMTCRDLREMVHRKKQAQREIVEHMFCRELNRVLLEKDDETARQKKQDQHVEILEELLLETSDSGRPSPHPDRCP